jgi:heme/copper-type cytochrome/quinol oxidase subunit 4
VTLPCFPRLRWIVAAFLAAYLPGYALAYGFANFLFLCNLSVILTAIGIWTCHRLLLSSQAVAALLVGAAWTVDAASRLLTGIHLIGGTEYMWDSQWPLFTRLLSLYHVALPVLLFLAVRRLGYDGRGYWLQSGIAIVAVAAGRRFGPTANINYAYVEPILKRSWGGPVTHVAVVAGFLVLLVYPLTHVLLARLCARPGA